MPLFDAHVRVTYVEYYVTEIEADTVDEARRLAIDQDDHRDGMNGAEHVCTEVRAVHDSKSGEELWDESQDESPADMRSD